MTVVSIDPPDLLRFMRQKDVQAFKRTAAHFKCYILLRRLNEFSKRFIGEEDCTPKPIDCKAKTAKVKFFHQGLNREIDLAGLVIDPTLDEFDKAYPGPAFKEAHGIWAGKGGKKGFVEDLAAPPVRQPGGGFDPVWIPGKRYFVDMDTESERYGAVMLTPTNQTAAAKYVHGDYDLYGIVPADNPTENIRVAGKLLGQPHTRGQMFFDVQHMLNREMGVAMVLHGSQEKFKTDMDDTVDVFFPDGRTVVCLRGTGMISSFYKRELKGRVMYTGSREGKPYFGQYHVI